jgi:hypothetical protein
MPIKNMNKIKYIKCPRAALFLYSTRQSTATPIIQSQKEPLPQLQSYNQSLLQYNSISYIMTFKSFLLAAVMAMSAHAENRVNVFYSTSSFSTIACPNGGNVHGHSSGITVADMEGKPLWNDKEPGGAISCANPNMELRIWSSCWDGEYIFNCGTDLYANIRSCGLKTSGGRSFYGEVDASIEFIGISISVSNTCGLSIPTRDNCDGATFHVVAHNP